MFWVAKCFVAAPPSQKECTTSPEKDRSVGGGGGGGGTPTQIAIAIYDTIIIITNVSEFDLGIGLDKRKK